MELNLPNKLTLLRVVLIPVFVIVLLTGLFALCRYGASLWEEASCWIPLPIPWLPGMCTTLA